MYHSLNIGEYNTWRDFFMVPEKMPAFSPPAPKTNYVDIPGADGSIDLSTVLTGEVKYSDRTGTIEFMIAPNHGKWPVLYSKIMNAIHGKRLRISLEDDPNWYYMGRMYLSAFENGKAYPSLTMTYTLEPYKYAMLDTDSAFLWDGFEFEEDTVRDWYTITVNAVKTMSFEWANGTTVPVFYYVPDGNTTLQIICTNDNGTYTGEYTVTDGEINSITDPYIQLVQGTNTLTFQGCGKIDIHATERSL